MKNRILGVVCLLAFLSPAAVAQFGGGIVFDPTQSGHAIAQIQQAQQLYTTALQTRNEIISTYNLARQMASLPNSLYQYYVTPWTNWTSVYAANTYGNVVGWRADSEARQADIRQMEAYTYTSDPTQHTDMATLQRINQAVLMQLRAQQDANQIAQAIALQQVVAQKQQQDALKAAFVDAASYQQQYNATVQPLTSGFGNTMSQSH